MIYLIWWPPKCWKTTLAKELSKKLWIPWVSTDTLQCVIKPYIEGDKLSDYFPTSHQRSKDNDEKYSKHSSSEIIDAYRKQAKTVYEATRMFCVCEITDGNDFIIEWYHIEPELVSELALKYPWKIKSMFLVKTDEEKFTKNIKNSTTPNDWIIERTNDENTYKKIAKMICDYSKIFEVEWEKYNFDVINMDSDFELRLEETIEKITM